mgnify:FL=1
MVSNRYILAGLNLVLLILIGCKTSEVVSGSKETATDRQLSDKEYREFQVAYMDGNREKILGNYQKAEALFQKALEIDPNSAATKFELAKLGMEKGELEKAIEYAKQAREADPDNPWYSEFLARAYAEGGRLEEAIEVIRDILDEHPEKYDYYFNLASLLSARGRHDEALKIYDDLESQFGAVEEISMQRQMIYLDQGNSEKALEEVNNLIELNPDEVRYLGMKAEILEEQGKIEEARKLYEDILVMDPDNGLVLLALYEIDEGTGKKEEAKAYLVGAFKSAELSIDVKVNILLNMLNRRDVDQDFLIKLSDELVDTHAKNAKSHAIRGDIFNNFQMPEKALESFEKAVEIDPNRPPIWQEIMILNSSLNRFEEMKSASEKALEYFPQQPIFYLFNGIALQQLGNHEEAIATLNAGKNLVIENNDLLGQFHSSLGDAYHALENHELSDKAYDKALKSCPSNVIVLNNYAYYLALRGQKLEKAEEMAKKANDLSPDQSSFQDTYAWVLFKRGNYQNALFWIQEAIKNSGSSDPEVLEHHGDILHALGRTKDAVAAWQMAIEAGGNASALTEKIEKNDKSEQ